MISILLVDYTQSFIESAKKYLQKDGDLTVTAVPGPAEALELLKSRQYDTIISDYHMPGMTGIQFLKTLRDRGNTTPVIIYATSVSPDIELDVLKSDATFFYAKPEDQPRQLSELKEIATELVRRKKVETALVKREKDFRSLVTQNIDAMIVLDRDGYIRYVNPAAVSLFKIPETELVGVLFGFPIILQEPVNMYILREFKSFIAVEMRMVEVDWGEKPSLLISLRDITGHINYEEKLRKMAEQLETIVANRTAELTETNHKLKEEIEARKKTEDELKSAKDQAEVYLDLMGHDINNLNQIGIGFLELAEESRDIDEVKSLIAKPLEIMQNTSRIIANVRLAQRTISKDIVLPDLDLCSLISQVRSEYSGANGRSITINYEGSPHCIIKAHNLVREVFTNLIENSIKHSSPEKPLVIDIRLNRISQRKNDYYMCTVEDNGPGIAGWVKDTIFKRYKRGDTKAHGKGLGLFIIKTIMDEIHGKIWVEDRVPGDYSKGAKFVMVFPAPAKDKY